MGGGALPWIDLPGSLLIAKVSVKKLLAQQENLLVSDYWMGPFFPEPRKTQQNRVAACFPFCDNQKMALAGNYKNPFFREGGGGAVGTQDLGSEY